jgi:hypothetical protein
MTTFVIKMYLGDYGFRRVKRESRMRSRLVDAGIKFEITPRNFGGNLYTIEGEIPANISRLVDVIREPTEEEYIANCAFLCK